MLFYLFVNCMTSLSLPSFLGQGMFVAASVAALAIRRAISAAARTSVLSPSTLLRNPMGICLTTPGTAGMSSGGDDPVVQETVVCKEEELVRNEHGWGTHGQPGDKFGDISCLSFRRKARSGPSRWTRMTRPVWWSRRRERSSLSRGNAHTTGLHSSTYEEKRFIDARLGVKTVHFNFRVLTARERFAVLGTAPPSTPAPATSRTSRVWTASTSSQ